jgi:hypothetical protein
MTVPPRQHHGPRPAPVAITVNLGRGNTIRKPRAFKAHAGSEVAVLFLNHDLVPHTAWIEVDQVLEKKGKTVTKQKAALFNAHAKSDPIPPLGFGVVRYRISDPGVLGLSQKVKKKAFKYNIALGDEAGELVSRLDPEGEVEMPPAM